MSYSINKRNRETAGYSWRAYQAGMQLHKQRRQRTRTTVRLLLLLAAVAVVGCGLFLSISGFAHYRSNASGPLEADAENREKKPDPLQDKQIARSLVDPGMLVNLEEVGFTLETGGNKLRVNTSLDPDLQRYMLKKMDRVNSRFIGIVAADPASGRIILLSGFNKENPDLDPCLDNQFPAASIFKIVSAAAAVEQCGLTSDSKMRFNGYAHTLYKRQLKDVDNRYTNHITFRDSFAKSINPVFGKIGTLYLDKSQIEQYARQFGFNQEINFEIEFPTSHLSIEEATYNWAEIASGFNNTTTLSPLHGVLVAAAVVNNGELVEPTVIDRITDASGATLYKGAPKSIHQAVEPSTSAVLSDMMQTTVRSGTARKTFRGYRKDGILSRLTIGGKTGSIFNRKHDLRFDWFVGFAEEIKGEKKLAVSVVVAHEEYIGIRAGQYARMVMRKHFSDYFSKRDEKKSSHPAG
ncbi:MAG: penicillin-binding transpeptidase domain-containing protein [Thermodesulfobacteriota bacterium]